MFKDYNKYLSASLKVYLFVLVIIFIMKMIGLDYFGLDVNNEFIKELGEIVSYNVPINNIVYFIPLILNQYILLSLTLNDNSKKMKIFNLILLPVFYLLEGYKIKIFGNFAMLIEIIYFFIVILIYSKKINKKIIKRFVITNLLIMFIQMLSMIARLKYPSQYILNPVLNILLNLDYIIALIIIYKINFMKGDEKPCYYQEVQYSSSQKEMSLKQLLKKLQVNLHNFKQQDKETKLTIIIYFFLSLIWNTFTVFVVLLFAKLNNTLIECIFIMTSFWMTKRTFGKAFHLPSMLQCFIVSNLTYYILNRITTPLGISIFIPIMLGVGLSYLTSKLVKKTYKPLYRGMPEKLFEETILKVVDKDSDKYNICYEYFIEKKSAVALSMKYNYTESGIKKLKDRVNNKIKELG